MTTVKCHCGKSYYVHPAYAQLKRVPRGHIYQCAACRLSRESLFHSVFTTTPVNPAEPSVFSELASVSTLIRAGAIKDEAVDSEITKVLQRHMREDR